MKEEVLTAEARFWHERTEERQLRSGFDSKRQSRNVLERATRAAYRLMD
jgi:hypothetical protein